MMEAAPPPPSALDFISGNPSVPVNNEAESPLPLEEIEKRHILNVLGQTGGNRTQAANLLGVSIRTLRNKLNAYRKDGVVIDGD